MTLAVRREELASVHDEWAALVEQVAEPVPFLHPTWQRVWLEEFQGDRELVLLTVRDGDALAGVAPFLREDGQLSLAGNYKICDYMDVVVAPGREEDVYPALLDALCGEEWSEVRLWGLRESSPTLGVLPSLALGAGLRVERETEAIAPRVHCGESWDGYLASLSKKDRHELRRKLRRLQGAGELQLQSYTSRLDLEEHLPLMLRMMIDSRSDKAAFMSEQMGRFFHRMVPALADEGFIRLYLLELDGKPIASILCFDHGEQLFLYNSGYDPDYADMAAGLISKALCINHAIECGKTHVDMLRGDEPYKHDLGGRDQTIYTCVISR